MKGNGVGDEAQRLAYKICLQTNRVLQTLSVIAVRTLSHVVYNHCDLHSIAIFEDSTKEGGLASTKETRKDGHRDCIAIVLLFRSRSVGVAVMVMIVSRRSHLVELAGFRVLKEDGVDGTPAQMRLDFGVESDRLHLLSWWPSLVAQVSHF